MEVNKGIEAPPVDVERLGELFERFNESSRHLQDSYEHLLHEAEALRSQLRAKDREVKRAERLAVLGETAAAMAHEVRNPLGAMKLFLSLLKDDLTDRPASLELVGELNRGVEAIDTVVSNILHFAKDRKLHAAPTDVAALARETAEHFRQMRRGTLELYVDAPDHAYVMGSADDLRRLLFNLVLNACEATNHEGYIKVAVRLADGTVSVRVRDNGPGIANEVLDRLFEPFVTTKNAGTGLGLAIVRRIVEQHGGEIQAWNDEGAVFEVRLPTVLAEKVARERGE